MYTPRPHPAPSAFPPPSRLLLPRVRPSPSSSCARSPSQDPSHDTALQWLGLPLNFDVVDDHLQIEGYQMYAVEKWIVERTRPITVLAVYTGDPSHKITVTALAPSPSLSERDCIAQWEQALLHLRRDASARPKQTPNGILMATSLAYFRSDYTIVHVPQGNFLLAKDQLYTNVNLLRMGCGSRSALSLEEPSDSTKERFLSTYHIPEFTLPSSLPIPPHYHLYLTSSEYLPMSTSTSYAHASKDTLLLASPNRYSSHRRSQSQSSSKSAWTKSPSNRPNAHAAGPSNSPTVRLDPNAAIFPSLNSSILALLAAHTKGRTKDFPFFNATVLELVKLVQAGLSLFGMYDVRERFNSTSGCFLFDGLLCDVTVQGIERWITEIGEPRACLEPAERIADPMFVSALLSLIMCVRNKLAGLGYSNVTPKDPFLHPQAFTRALSTYVSAIGTHSQSHSPAIPNIIPRSIAGHHLPNALLSANVSTPPYAAAAFLNQGGSALSQPPSMLSVSNSSSTNATRWHSSNVSTVLTRELIEFIEAAYSKRVASLSITDDVLGNISSNLGAGGANGNTNGVPVGTGLRGDSGNTNASGVYGGQVRRRKVKRVLKDKLEDLTNAVANDDGALDGGRDDRGRGRLSEDEAEDNLHVGTSGGQLFREVGNLIMSGASGMASTGGGVGCIYDVNTDLQKFAKIVVEKEGSRSKLGMRAKRKRGVKGTESIDFGKGNLSIGSGGGPTHGDYGVIAAMLWSGRVTDVVVLREWEKERENLVMVNSPSVAGGIMSDGEEAKSEGFGGRSTEGEESDLQEGRLGGSFGGVWSEKMQKKLESWTGLSKRRGPYSVDLGNSSTARQPKFPLGSRSPSSKMMESKNKEGVQSPTFSAGEQDDGLDSGQVSPSSDYKSQPFSFQDAESRLKGTQLRFYNASRGVSSTELGRSEHGLGNGSVPDMPRSTSMLGPAFVLDADKAKSYVGLHERKWGRRPARNQKRISSWSDTRSAWGDEGFWMIVDKEGRKKAKEAEDVLDEKRKEDGSDNNGDAEEDRNKIRSPEAQVFRRRSFHDIGSLRPMRVLSPERMKIDVELCAQVLTMVRREEHLHNIIICLEVLSSRLRTTNTELKQDLETHRAAIDEIDEQSRVISEIDARVYETNQITQARNMLQYEAAQLEISEIWHMASLWRQQVFELREKVFGTGRRRLRSGKHGAHGKFNRVQWTLDGERRLVDHLGRTEAEAEEEDQVNAEGITVPQPVLEEEEGDVVEHAGPVWLLRFFTSWVARWSALKAGGGTAESGKEASTK
ncbi:hypothetical protein Agabi119p4_4304 [Agaricus bisporus var. burnettii]|uniref:STB6-like N-terminal domain-containing protein n=1 Tax=Agaricus bisporus var. burnettii TaxID=192524 RepID=A0A8H7F324_AGABI|nr:hypothetical protein Agabi119p4_4304 [Agaricus bisporus var. burnettii]